MRRRDSRCLAFPSPPSSSCHASADRPTAPACRAQSDARATRCSNCASRARGPVRPFSALRLDRSRLQTNPWPCRKRSPARRLATVRAQPLVPPAWHRPGWACWYSPDRRLQSPVLPPPSPSPPHMLRLSSRPPPHANSSTIRRDGAIPAARVDRPAHVLSPCDQIKIEQRPPPRLGRAIERLLGLFRLPRLHPAETIRDPMHVRVHADVLAALEAENQHQVRRLAADTRQHHQLLHRRRDPAPEPLDEHLAAGFYMARLVAIEADGIDQLLDLPHLEPRHRPRRAGPSEQPCGRRVRRRILRARGEQRRDEDLKRILGLRFRDLLDRRQIHAGDLAAKRAHDALYVL